MRHQRGPVEHFSETEERLTEALARLIFAGVAPEERRQRIAGRRGTVHREVGDERLRLARRQRQDLARARTSVDGAEQRQPKGHRWRLGDEVKNIPHPAPSAAAPGRHDDTGRADHRAAHPVVRAIAPSCID